MKKIMLILISVFLLVMFSNLAAAATNNVTNKGNKTTQVTITSTAPFVVNVSFTNTDGTTPLDLSPATTSKMNCTGYAGDIDGVADISTVNATVYLTTTGPTASDNYTNHYTIANNSCTQTNYNATHLTYNCDVDVYFNAQPGGWTCNVSVWDSAGLNASNTDTASMSSLLAININASTLDFGNMQVGTNTTTNDYNITVINDGNVIFDVKMETFGNTPNDNLTMDCTTSNITNSNWLRYSLTAATTWYSKRPINNTAYTDTSFNLVESQVGSGTVINTSNKSISWGMGIPTALNNCIDGDCPGQLNSVVVAGTCNGNLSIIAVQS